ncbi:hypothetical protein YTPLAS18_37780 [Nitrospira sp.]|nr:hypothetical protein YTPLAS18_37780 [Nitrospira sp.]
MMNTPAVRAMLLRLALLSALLAGTVLPQQAAAVEVSTTARLLPSGEGIELEYRSEGETWTDVIPIYQGGQGGETQGAIRYFSAGVGMAERQAKYPPFPLKIVLTAGTKPYAAHADVHIVEVGGDRTLSIPSDRVHGPWLFVDLPPGTYDITGNRGPSTATLRRVTISAGGEHVVYLRFPEEPDS